ncbi:16S rRNA (guanine(966)-N(2))-methyltransferase RsmD [Mycoplasmopsis primatum]|uniref:16S rRNA (guanine(966)-N(2))-methyltransferase RsmD n=1 Tax=Mycoplasmopsis primatum TaxID=55604 RepID=UPI000495FD83|nr:16S rRNA (guanine(966)-N(2))-methyltransferase RsmD [Mycoplasmopsis primatum]
MRIISGKFRHRLIDWPKSKDIRPTMDKVREAIFSSIRNNIEGSVVLDLFGGSGSMGIEAISNGAAKAIIIDNSIQAVNVIKSNIASLQITNIDVFKTDAATFLTNKVGMEFDYIFIDPPYNKFDLLNECLALIERGNFLSKYGYIIIETNETSKITIPPNLMVQKTKKYGKTFIIYLSHIN